MSENKVADLVEKIIHATIMTVARNAAKAALVAEAPWLKLPVISQVFDFILGRSFGFVSQQLETQAVYTTIDFQTQAQTFAYLKAVNKLRQNPEDVNAQKDFEDTLAELIRTNRC